MSMVQAQVLYDSLLYRQRTNVFYTGTNIDGFEPINAFDWRDFSIFRASAGSVDIRVQVPNGGLVDTLVVWQPAGGPSAPVVTVSTSPDGTTWTPIGNVVSLNDGAIRWLDLTPVTLPANGWVKVNINDATYTSDWRQISVGAKMTFPIGQWVGVNPPKLYQGVVVESVIANNGSILGRNLRRLEKKGNLNLTHLLPAWVRDTWDPFAIECGRHAFWHRWDPVGHPTEVSFAVAESIEAPVNMLPPPRMSVAMPIRFLT